MDISHLFKPLDEKERAKLEDAIISLSDNNNFILFLRDLFEKSNPLSPTFLDRVNNDPYTAAKKDGEKNAARFLLNIIINKNAPIKRKKRTQKTDSTFQNMMKDDKDFIAMQKFYEK